MSERKCRSTADESVLDEVCRACISHQWERHRARYCTAWMINWFLHECLLCYFASISALLRGFWALICTSDTQLELFAICAYTSPRPTLPRTLFACYECFRSLKKSLKCTDMLIVWFGHAENVSMQQGRVHLLHVLHCNSRTMLGPVG